MSDTTEVPFVKVGDRLALTDEQLADDPSLLDFVKRFPDSFEYDSDKSIWLFKAPEYGQKNEQAR